MIRPPFRTFQLRGQQYSPPHDVLGRAKCLQRDGHGPLEVPFQIPGVLSIQKKDFETVQGVDLGSIG